MKIDELVDKFNRVKNFKGAILVTAGGKGKFVKLLSRGNGSNTLLSGMIPYSMTDLITLLGKVPDKVVSVETARQMAMSAYMKAVDLIGKDDYDVIGIGATSSLQRVPNERVGRVHEIHVALQTKDST